MNAIKSAICVIVLSWFVVGTPPVDTHAPLIAAPPVVQPETKLAGPFEVVISPSPAPEHEQVYVRTSFEAKFFELEVLTIDGGTLRYKSTVKTDQPGEWVFTGPPGEYSVKLRAFDPDKGIKAAAGNVTIQGRVVTPTVPAPTPNDPTVPPAPVDPKKKITKVTYVWEKDNSAVPRAVASTLARINAESSGGVVATEFEEDTHDGTGDTPEQYKVALEAARKAGLPALVIQAGATVLRVVKDPKTEAEIREAMK